MAELIWKAADPHGAGHVATYNAHGAIVKVYREPPGKGMPAPADGVPAWVRVGMTLAEKRIREYLEATGHLPSRALLEEFQRVMGERLEAYIEDPMKHPFRPMGLKAFEDEMRGETNA